MTVSLISNLLAVVRDGLISDFALTSRTTIAGESRLVTYVVPDRPLSLTDIKEQLHRETSTTHNEIDFVPVSVIPLGSDGQLDMTRLSSIAVITEQVVHEMETALNSVNRVARSAVMSSDNNEPVSIISLSNILLDSSSSGDVMMLSSLGRPESSPPEDRGFAVQFAECDGGPIIIPDNSPKTLTDALLLTAASNGSKGLVFPDEAGHEIRLDYASLLGRALKVLTGLRKTGLQAQDKVILQLNSLEQHYVTFWACVLGGIIPVAVAPPLMYTRKTSVSDKLVAVWEFLGNPAIIASTANAGVLQDLSTHYRVDAFDILRFEDIADCEPADELREPAPSDIVFFQLTSGSTGTPKCIQETHQGIIAHIHGSAQSIGYATSDITFNWLPVDHVVPILTFHVKDVYLGCTQVHVRPDYVLSAPLRWLDCIERYRVTHTWSPNFGFKLLCDGLRAEPEKTWDIQSVRYFMNAGEQVTAEVVQDFLGWMGGFGLPNTVMQPAFGMAETCTCMTYENQFDVVKNIVGYRLQGAEIAQREIPLVELGKPIPGVRIRITDSINRMLPEGAIGRLQITGTVVTPGYYQNISANDDAFVGDGWFNSGDLGFIKNGRLTVTGREKEAINIRGATIFCHEVEEVVESIEGVEPTFAAAVATPDPTTGTESLAIFYVPTMRVPLPILQQAITREVATNIGATPLYIVPVKRERFPKTTSGKKQRLSLQKAIISGEFKDFMEPAAVARGIAATLPAWFYRPAWRRKATVTRVVPRGPGQRLLFVSDDPIAVQLYQAIAEEERAPIVVRHGSVYNVKNDREFQIDSTNAEHYHRLFAHLHEAGLSVSDVFHLWTCVASSRPQTATSLGDEIAYGVVSLLHLANALRRYATEENKIAIVVASQASQQVNAGESLVPARSMLASLARTIAQEIPSISCRHVDLESPFRVESLLTEAQFDDEPEVAYRDGQRFVRRLEKVDIKHGASRESPFRKGQLYVLTGGLGGVGVEIATFLLKTYALRLLLVGRKPLKEGSEPMRAYRMLSALPGDVIYESVDVADAVEIDKAITRAAARFGCNVAGIIHMAGTYREQPLLNETNASFLQTLVPKVQGTAVLCDIARRHPGAVFIGFSSVIGYFGGAMVGAYAAANRFLDSSCELLRATGGAQVHSVCWSSWDGIGLSKDYHGRDLLAARGYLAMTAEQGINSLRVTLRQQSGVILVGLDQSKRFIQRHLFDCFPLTSLSCYVEGKDVDNDHLLICAKNTHDAYGAELKFQIQQVETVPLDQNGAVDYDVLRAQVQAKSSGGTVSEPRDDLESRVADIWCDILHLRAVSVTDNFFDIGGDSARIARLEHRIKQKVSSTFDIIDLFKYPTIRGFCTFLNNDKNKVAENGIPMEGSKRGAIRKAFAAKRKKASPVTQPESP
ncbi:MAG: SDR family NAD(P)-dependent oxidoreductase [Gammaproteobacteria bacterium]